MIDPLKKLKQAKIDLGVKLLQYFSKQQSLVHSPSDLSLKDAQRFAESLMLVTKGNDAQELMQKDTKGIKAFLSLIDNEGISKAYENVHTYAQDDDTNLPYAPIASWILDIIEKRNRKYGTLNKTDIQKRP